MSEYLHILRNVVLQSQTATRVLKWPVNLYREGLYHVGPDETSLSIGDELTVTFRTETRQEIRHFYPVYGEQRNIAELVADIRPTDVFYDIGAHVGIYSCVAAQVLTGPRVFAFEPHPKNSARLAENADLNGVGDVHVYQRALSDSSGTKEIGVDANEPGAVGHSDPSTRETRVTVEFVRGDEFVVENELPHPTVLKIDVEGAELQALRGLEGVLGECRVIYCEVSDRLERYGDSESKLLDWLVDRGYEIQSLGKGGVVHDDIRAVRTT